MKSMIESGAQKGIKASMLDLQDTLMPHIVKRSRSCMCWWPASFGAWRAFLPLFLLKYMCSTLWMRKRHTRTLYLILIHFSLCDAAKESDSTPSAGIQAGVWEMLKSATTRTVPVPLPVLLLAVLMILGMAVRWNDACQSLAVETDYCLV